MPELMQQFADRMAKSHQGSVGPIQRKLMRVVSCCLLSLADLWAKAQLQNNRNRMLIAFVGEQSGGGNESRNRLHQVERGWQVACL